MKQSFLRAAALAAIAALAACSGNSGSIPPAASGSLLPQSSVTQSCAQLLPGDDARCFAEFRTDLSGTILKGGRSVLGATRNAAPSGYGPADLQSAYNLPSTTAGSGETVGIVDAYDDPNAASDLNTYRSYFGLPACTTSNGCFKKVNQTGGTKYPSRNGGWAQEISLDLDMVSAVCPNCHIILVEASTASFSNLDTAVNTAVSLGANVVSNSYGGSETGASNSAYSHAGHVIVASSGDNSYTAGPQQPCSYATVVCAGGTSLVRASNSRGWSETAWVDAGSGCSAYVAAMSWQKVTCSGKRPESDVSAVADPHTGVAVYDSYAYQGYSGWMVFGGTSVASPVIASVYALAGNAGSVNASQSVYAAAGTSALNDVTSGNNNGGSSCSPSFICNAGAGYDGPTGNGTPNGVSAF